MRRLRRLFPALALGAAAPALAQPAPAASPAALPPDFDAYVARVLQAFDVPGAAVAVVKDGRVLVAKGYGVRTLGRPEPVDAATRFGIASNTKAFTAAALALLVEEGKVEWDAPVVRYLPEFALYDPWVTREVTVRDLLVHRSGLGLGAGDLLWWPASTYDRAEIMRRLRFIKPATSFRSAYAYDNVLYLVAGRVIERVSGRSWEDFVRERILAPVGMAGSTVRYADAPPAGGAADRATPHAEVDGRVRAVAPDTSDATNPAGGINSTAADMAKWMLVQLDSGRIDGGRRLFAAPSARELWTGVTPVPIGRGAAPAGFEHLRPHFRAYALGFLTSDYRGRYELQHSGGLPGYTSLVTMLPGERAGVAVLTNAEASGAWDAITYRTLDALLGAAPPDYLALFTRVRDRDRAALAASARAAAAARDSASRPSLPLARYAGAYEDAWYGRVDVAHEPGPNGGRLVIRFSHTPQLTGDLVPWQHDTFVARWRDRELRADAYVTFALTPDGKVDQVKLAPASPDVDFSFDFQDLLLRPVVGAASAGR
ncbi:serine hydrolase [Gemmatimonadetes bacterium T265]|nr:serine hydrolase [Gemmatimonadetes bacterium T265]